VLLISSDTRPLEPSWESRTYSTMTMALNRHYAQHHGYDFAFVRTFASSKPPGANLEARDAACFHPGFQLWRVHNWCKVLTLWAAATAVEEVPQDRRVLQARLVQQVRQVSKDSKDLLANKGYRALLVPLVHPVHPVQQASKAQAVHLAQAAHLAQAVHLAQAAHLALRVS
jgi:hypothetical protein